MGMLKSICSQLAFRESQGDQLVFDMDAAASGVLSDKYRTRFEEILAGHLQIPCRIRIECQEHQTESPAKYAARRQREALESAEQELMASSMATMLLSDFDARLIAGSIQLEEPAAAVDDIEDEPVEDQLEG